MADSTEDGDFQEKSDRFVDWLKKSGATISPKIELADLRTQGAGRGVIAKEDIEEDEELFSIPRSAILDVSTSCIPKEITEELDDPWLLQILAMLCESRSGKESNFKPYFDVLPHSFDTLMYWTEGELKYLEGSAVVHKIGKKNADETFREQVFPIVYANPDVFHAAGIAEAEWLSECHRMGSLIMAYAFDLEIPPTANGSANDEWEEDKDSEAELSKGMIPLADMLNADADRNNARLFYEDDGSVSMRTIKPVKKGGELFNDYGPLPRADVLRRYGYVTDNYAQYDVSEVSRKLIEERAKSLFNLSKDTLNARIEYLDQRLESEVGIGLSESFDIVLPSSEEGQFPDELRALLNVLTMPEEEFGRLRRKEKPPKPELSQASLRFLERIIDDRYAMFPSEAPGSEQDPPVTEQGARRCIMARAVITGELEVLNQARRTISDMLNDSTKRKADEDPNQQPPSKKPKPRSRAR